MSSEATAIMANIEPFAPTHTVVNSQTDPQPQFQHQLHPPIESNLPYGEAVSLMPPQPPQQQHYQSVPPGFPPIVNNHSNSSSIEQKRKRGRPRKYGPEGGLPVPMAPSQMQIGGSLAEQPQSQPQQQTFSGAQFAMQMGGTPSTMVKKSRGRPRGSCNKKHPKQTSGSAANGFTPHVLKLNGGEDISSKILSISQNGPRVICVMSATGAISDVTLRQLATSGGTVTYKGQFDILSLSGCFLPSEVDGQKSRIGGLSVALAGSDGRIMGGCVAGALIAASPVQVLLGTFLQNVHSEAKANDVRNSSAPPPQMNHLPGGSNSPSRGTVSESSGGDPSPVNLSSGICDNVQLDMSWK